MHNYNFLEQKIHQLVLGSELIKKSLFEIEKIIFDGELLDHKDRQHVFITGLPRSGTTILLNYLYQSKIYASLTYEDMPFILSPNLFAKFKKNKNIYLTERIHKDGIKISLQSPEAFDDIFFQLFNEDQVKQNLSCFVSLILARYKKTLYLSKNNNNFKRIELILSVLPCSKIIIPFRNALQHANSLLSQHQHFCDIQSKNKFILKYMNYLGHLEFGLDHRSWNFPKKFTDRFSLNYWLEQWFLFYEKLIRNYSTHPSVIFVSYETLCKDQKARKNLLKKLDINFNSEFTFLLSKKNISKHYDKNLLDECLILEKNLSNWCSKD